jgi:hypothetical protein
MEAPIDHICTQNQATRVTKTPKQFDSMCPIDSGCPKPQIRKENE